MKKIHFLPWLALVALLLMAFVPSMTDFNPNQFPTTGNKVSIISGATATNLSLWGIQVETQTGIGPTDSPGLVLTNRTAAANGSQQDSPSLRLIGNGWNSTGGGASQPAGFDIYALPIQGTTVDALLGFLPVINGSAGVGFTFQASTGNISVPGTFTAAGATASTVTSWNASKSLVSIPNGTGSLTNDGAGVLGWSTASGAVTQGGVSTNSILQATNIIGIQDSICIPAGGFFSFNLSTPSTNATFIAVTNLCEGWVFTDAITNEIRARFALPYDWDGGTVKMQISALCTGTNANVVNQTNVVFAVAAAALTAQADVSSPTFGTAVWVTNAISKSAWIEGNAVTGPITVGNTPNATKSILWQIQRLGAQGGDTLTNSSLVLTEARIFFTRNLTTTNGPTSSP